jgi:uncharacterized protein (DUF427 family)
MSIEVNTMPKLILEPSPQHPISVEALGRRVTVLVANEVIAESDDALELREANYPPVIYIPRKDAQMSRLVRSSHASYCPFKGDANYFDIPAAGEKGKDCVWTYEQPYDSVAAIKDFLAFYPDRVTLKY